VKKLSHNYDLVSHYIEKFSYYEMQVIILKNISVIIMRELLIIKRY